MAEPIPEIQLPPITILANGSNDAEREANLKTVLSSPGYPETLFMLVEVFERRVEDVLLDYTRGTRRGASPAPRFPASSISP